MLSRRSCCLPCFVVAVLTSCTSLAIAANWPSWRGPSLNGVAPDGDYPLEWSEDAGVEWQVDLPGVGGSTPAVWEDHIFLTAPIDEQNAVLCYNWQGDQLWAVQIGDESAGKHRKGSGCNPSPVTDGERVYVYFKSGDFAALDFEGNIVWQHNLQEMFGEDTLWWDLGTSPIRTSQHVVVTCMHSGPSYLAAFDPATGDLVWKQDRNLDAPEEAAQSYSTPVICTGPDGRETIVVVGADFFTAHDAATGEELWRVGELNPEQNHYNRSIASPVAEGDLVVAPYSRGESMTVVRLGGEGDVRDSHIVWAKTGIGADVPTPIAHDGRIYNCRDGGLVTCLDLATGDELWKTELPSNRNAFSASPVLAGNRLYLAREDGATFVLPIDGESHDIIAENQVEGFVVATPVFANGRILIRTDARLYCIGG